MDYLRDYVSARTPLYSRKWGTLQVESASFSPARDGDLVVEVGTLDDQEELLLRIHSECTFGQVFSSDLCDCAEQLERAMDRLVTHGRGMLVYLRFDGRGAGLAAKVKATALEMNGMDTYSSREAVGAPPEAREFRSVGEYLRRRSFTRVRLLTNNPLKAGGLQEAGLKVETESLLVPDPSVKVRHLYRTKRERFNHDIPEALIGTDDEQGSS